MANTKSSTKFQKLEKLMGVFEEGSVQPEELIQAVETIMGIIKQSQDVMLSKVDEKDRETKQNLSSLISEVDQAISKIDSYTKTLAATKDVEKMRSDISAELKRVADSIPEMPAEFDASELEQIIEDHRVMLNGLSELVVGENIRNALESLPDGEKLAQEAVEGLPEALQRLEQVRQQTTAIIARRLDQISDVDVAGVTNGQVLAYNSTTERWEAATVSGTGDMTKAVYDPNAIEGDAFDMTNMDATAWRVFYANATGDVTELALGANNTFLKSNGATSAPTFATPTATVAELNDVGDVTITTPADNEVVAYDTTSGDFINQTPAEAGLQEVLTEGAFVDGDKTKLDGIEANADVTDTVNVTAAGALMESEVDADIKTLSLPASTTISAFGASLVDDIDAATARTTLDVDQAGTDNSTDVTLAGTPNYITIAGQVITRAPINLTSHVTGVLPIANGGTNASTAATAFSNIKQAASTTATGVVERDTDAEFTTGTDTTRYVTANQVANVAQTMANKTFTDAKVIGAFNAQTGTTYTLVLSDASKHVTMTNASANTLTVPPNSSVAFSIGTRIMVQQKGAGSTTIAAGAGVTINAPSTVTLAIGEQYESRGLLKTATDTWELI